MTITTLGAVALVLYTFGALASVRPVARLTRWSFTNADGEDQVGPAGCIAIAIVVAYMWPLYALGWLLWRAGRALTPLVFEDQ